MLISLNTHSPKGPHVELLDVTADSRVECMCRLVSVANKQICLNKIVYFSCTKCNRTVVFTHRDEQMNKNYQQLKSAETQQLYEQLIQIDRTTTERERERISVRYKTIASTVLSLTVI